MQEQDLYLEASDINSSSSVGHKEAALAIIGILLSLLLLAMVGCTTKPTVVKEKTERKALLGQYANAFQILPDSIVLDARPPFEYSLSHIPRSLPIQWTDFTESTPEQKGILQADHYEIARRLARLGITPDSHVAIVGQGFRGHGEEGRIAWMLAYLGVKDVRFAETSVYKGHVTTETSEPISATIWKPAVIENLNVTRAELQYVLNNSGTFKPLLFIQRQTAQPGSPVNVKISGANGERETTISPPPAPATPAPKAVLYRLIDVRSAKDYLGREGFGAAHPVPNMEAINIPWKEFFDPTMKPNREIRAQLKTVGVGPENRIIVLSDDGVTSTAVTMALRALGYPNSGNYAGGLIDLMSAYGR